MNPKQPTWGLADFAKKLMEANDLDPVYVAVNGAGLDRPDLERWLLAYWCFYHSGTASWIADSPRDFWPRMATAAASKDYPRSRERRHFRGALAIESVKWLADQDGPALFAPFRSEETLAASDVIEWVKTWKGFGPWIAFKAADMIERLGLAKVDFDRAGKYLYDSPLEGALLAKDWYHPEKWDHEDPADVVDWAFAYVLDSLGATLAPPRTDRYVNNQEAETILCKWNSHVGGHYVIGEDVAALRKSLVRFAKCKTSQRLLRAGKEGGLW